VVTALVVYVMGLAPAYILARWVDVRDSEGWIYPAWVLAALWPALALVVIFIAAIVAYIQLDEALKREGV
jgi:hypothetical protein